MPFGPETQGFAFKSCHLYEGDLLYDFHFEKIDFGKRKYEIEKQKDEYKKAGAPKISEEATPERKEDGEHGNVQGETLERLRFYWAKPKMLRFYWAKP